MKLKHVSCACLVMLFMATSTLGVFYQWTGITDENWTECGNWRASAFPSCYPGRSDDDALIPNLAGYWAITLDFTSRTIDDLTILDEGTFSDGGSAATLSVDTLTITGSACIGCYSTVEFAAGAHDITILVRSE